MDMCFVQTSSIHFWGCFVSYINRFAIHFQSIGALWPFLFCINIGYPKKGRS
jgi:hypothetical protein